MTKKPEQKSHDNNNVAQSFIFNEQMSKIRQAEMVILAEEKKFGVLSKDPEGRLMPRLQALTRQAAHELKKDNYRPLIEPAHTASYAPHASNSDIGVAPPNWTPSMDTTTTAAAAYQHLTSGESNPNPINPNSNTNPTRKASASSISISNSMNNLASAAAGTTTEQNLAHSFRMSQHSSASFGNLYNDNLDPTLKPNKRGEGKIGGLLIPLQTKGSDSRKRKPIKTTLTSEMEFKRTRNIRTLSEKIDEINRLKDSIIEEKRKLDEQMKSKTASLYQQSTSIKPLTSDFSYHNNTISNTTNNSNNIVKNIVSNRTYGTAPLPSYQDAINSKTADFADTTSTKNNTITTSSPKPILNKSNSNKNLQDDTGLNRKSSPIALTRQNSNNTPNRPRSGFGEYRPRSGSGEWRDNSPSLSRSGSRKRLNSLNNNDNNIDIQHNNTNTTTSSKMNYNRDNSPTQTKRKNSINKTQFSEDVEVFEHNNNTSNNNTINNILLKETELMKIQTNNKNNELKLLNNKEIEIKQKLNHYQQDENRIITIKNNERITKNRELSRNIERKRRLLHPDAVIRTGPPPDDPVNMYDYYSIKVQSVIRGFITRCWIKWYRKMSIKAIIILQSCLRGWFGRMRVRRIRKYYNAARIIQKNFRGWFTRVSYSSFLSFIFVYFYCIFIVYIIL